MKRLIAPISALLLLTVFLLATIGVSISKHMCQITGHADIAFFASDDFTGCCPMDKGCSSKSDDDKPGCCSDQQDYVKADIIKKHEEHADLDLKLPVLASAELAFATTQAPSLTNLVTEYRAIPPPPLSGAQILKDIQVFRL